jgi:uncharacterized protein (TIGR02246 family)
MTTNERNALEATRIRTIIEGWASAVRAKDANGLLAHLAPDVLLFDLIDPLQYTGVEEVRKRAEQWLSSWQGPLLYEVRDLAITAGNEVAFCHSINRVSGVKIDGTKIDMKWRATVCFREIDGDWTAIHEHSSVPFDMNSGIASFNAER